MDHQEVHCGVCDTVVSKDCVHCNCQSFKCECKICKNCVADDLVKSCWCGSCDGYVCNREHEHKTETECLGCQKLHTYCQTCHQIYCKDCSIKYYVAAFCYNCNPITIKI